VITSRFLIIVGASSKLNDFAIIPHSTTMFQKRNQHRLFCWDTVLMETSDRLRARFRFFVSVVFSASIKDAYSVFSLSEVFNDAIEVTCGFRRKVALRS